MKPLSEWLVEYLAFRVEVVKICGQRIPADMVSLQKEAYELEPLYFRAEDMRSDAASYYYKAKHEKIDALHKEGFAVSALSELAKAACYKENWARENSEGVCNAIRDRKIKVSQFMKLMSPI